MPGNGLDVLAMSLSMVLLFGLLVACICFRFYWKKRHSRQIVLVKYIQAQERGVSSDIEKKEVFKTIL